MHGKLPRYAKFGIVLFTIILLVYALMQARNLLYPLVFGILLSYLLYPLVNYMEMHRIPRIIAILISEIVAIVVIGAILFLFYTQLSNLFDNFSELKQRVNQNIETLQVNLEQILGLQNDRVEQFLKEQASLLFAGENNAVRKLFSATTGTIIRIIILPIYTFLFLFYRTKFAYFILKIVAKEKQYVTIKILRDISTVAGRYMGGVTIVVLILCVLNSVGLMIIGFKYAILFGLLSAFFNFIPYFGTIMGGSIPLVFALLGTTDPIYYGVRVFFLFLIIQFTENYILTPNIVGGQMKLNPFFIIIGLIVGASVWGIPGMLVIVPTLAIVRIITKNVESLKPYSYLLGPKGTLRHSITVKNLVHMLGLKKVFKRH